MMNLKNKCAITVLLILAFSVISCFQNNNREKYEANNTPPANNAELKEALIHQNRQLIREEIEHIDAYADRHGLQLDTTSTGLRYLLIERTNGKKAKLLSDVTISYKAELLDGKFCYSSDSSGKASFILGQSNQPSGLQEGLLLLHEGEKAIMIIPSYLAYGVTGDGVCIPGSASILYTVKLEKVTY